MAQGASHSPISGERLIECLNNMLRSTMNPEKLYPEQWREYIKRKQNGTDEMTLEQFLAYWQVSRLSLAIISECSMDTVNHWFSEGSSHREPNQHHRRRLAEAHRELLRMTRYSSAKRKVYDNVPNHS
jgi:hypothetical protein